MFRDVSTARLLAISDGLQAAWEILEGSLWPRGSVAEAASLIEREIDRRQQLAEEVTGDDTVELRGIYHEAAERMKEEIADAEREG